MENIKFDEENYNKNIYKNSGSQESKGFAGFLIKNGLASSTKSANMISIVITLCFFGISIYVFAYGFNAPSEKLGPDPSLQLPLLEN